MTSVTPKPRAGEHVVEPIRYVRSGYGSSKADWDIVNGNGGRFASTPYEDRARRFVAMWNYCEGVSTAEIEAAPPHLHLKAMLDLIDKDLAAVVDQRNALRAALASIDQLMMAMPLTSKIEHQVHGIAHRAVAKARL